MNVLELEICFLSTFSSFDGRSSPVEHHSLAICFAFVPLFLCVVLLLVFLILHTKMFQTALLLLSISQHFLFSHSQLILTADNPGFSPPDINCDEYSFVMFLFLFKHPIFIFAPFSTPPSHAKQKNKKKEKKHFRNFCHFHLL